MLQIQENKIFVPPSLATPSNSQWEKFFTEKVVFPQRFQKCRQNFVLQRSDFERLEKAWIYLFSPLLWVNNRGKLSYEILIFYMDSNMGNMHLSKFQNRLFAITLLSPLSPSLSLSLCLFLSLSIYLSIYLLSFSFLFLQVLFPFFFLP